MCCAASTIANSPAWGLWSRAKIAFCKTFRIAYRLFTTMQPSITDEHCQRELRYASIRLNHSYSLLIKARFIKQKLSPWSVSTAMTTASRIPTKTDNDFQSRATIEIFKQPNLRTYSC